SNLSLTDIDYGNKLDLTMKLIGFANRVDDQIEVTVQPTFLSKNHPLTSVNDEYNAVYVNGENVGETMFYGSGSGSLPTATAVFVNGEYVGETMFYGSGAGCLPTATAVMSDVVNAIKNMLLGVNGKKYVKPRFEKKLTPASKRYSQFYLRLHVKDELGAFATI